jgi:phosphatidylinositol-3-phosphatase
VTHTGRVRRPRLLAGLLALGTLAAACSGEFHAEGVRAKAAPLWVNTVSQRPAKVLIVVEENRTPRAALTEMPYLASLASAYGKTTAYKAVAHPSLPNYLALAGGSTFGVRDDAGPSSHHITGPSVFDRVIAGGRTSKTYAEAMPSPCSLTSTSRYAVKHNPWAYFSDPASRANCRRFDVPLGTTTAGALRHDVDAGTLPTVGLVIPDICHDGHDCSLATADAWLKSWLTIVRQGPDYRARRLAIVVTFDEDDYSGNNTVQTVVVSPFTSHVVMSGPLTHYSLTRYLAELTSTAPLRAAAGAPSLRAAFGL